MNMIQHTVAAISGSLDLWTLYLEYSHTTVIVIVFSLELTFFETERNKIKGSDIDEEMRKKGQDSPASKEIMGFLKTTVE